MSNGLFGFLEYMFAYATSEILGLTEYVLVRYICMQVIFYFLVFIARGLFGFEITVKIEILKNAKELFGIF